MGPVSPLRRQDSIRDNIRAAPLRARRALQSIAARPNPAPIFVLGHQKSGTSAIAALLAELTGSSVTVDLLNEDRWPAYARIASGEMSFERFVRRNRLDFSREIVKEPNLTFFYPQLADRFPGARFVIVVRDPRTNVKSVLDRLGLPGDREAIAEERLPKLRHGWRLMLDPSWLGLSEGNYVELLAQRWNLCADVYLEHAKHLRCVRYEDFREAKLETLETLARRLDLECRHDIGGRLDRQFQPAGNRAVSVREFFGAGNLTRIEDACRGRMERLGYGPSVPI
jgi:Sulfotransferase family